MSTPIKFSENLKDFIRNSQMEDPNQKESNIDIQYDALTAHHIVRIGGMAYVPFISFLWEGQKTNDGIYPVFLYYKSFNLLILAYGVSATNTPKLSWLFEGEEPVTVGNYLKTQGYYSDKPGENKYNDSYVFRTWPVRSPEDINESIDAPLHELTQKYESMMRDYEQLSKAKDDLVANPQKYLKTKTITVKEIEAKDVKIKKRQSSKRGGKVKVDYAQKEVHNKALGDLGEFFVVEYEKEELRKAGRSDLVDSVTRVSETDDSLGYDIKSYDTVTGSEIHIEVKTTKGNKKQPFFITANELTHSINNSDISYLYRLSDYDDDSKSFNILKIKGNLTPLCTSPELYSVTLEK